MSGNGSRFGRDTLARILADQESRDAQNFAHLEDLVAKGSRVSTAKIIALYGQVGRRRWPHLRRLHPAYPVLEHLQGCRLAVELLRSYYVDLISVVGRLQAIEETKLQIADSEWKDALFSLTKDLFSFCSAATAVRDALRVLSSSSALSHERVQEGRTLHNIDPDLCDFIFRFRNFVSHIRIHQPDLSISVEYGEDRVVTAKLSLPKALLMSRDGIWNAGAKRFLAGDEPVDIRETFGKFLEIQTKILESFERRFYQQLSDDERQLLSLDSKIQISEQLNGHLLILGIANQSKHIDPFRFLQSFLSKEEYGMVRSHRDGSDAQVRTLFAFKDPARLASQYLKKSVKDLLSRQHPERP